MFAKVFYQIFESSISEDYLVRHVFMDLLVLADEEGVVDKTPGAISRITNVPLEIVETAIRKLCQPDPHSRTKEEDGRRLMLIDEHRDWGWRIVNYPKYRNIRDEEARRISNRSYKRLQRQMANQEQAYVYFAQSGTAIKIAFSPNPWARINDMKSYAPDVRLLAVQRGTMAEVRELHNKFREYRRDREWFSGCDGIMNHIAALRKNGGNPETVVRDNLTTPSYGHTTSAHTEVDVDVKAGSREK